MSKNLEKLKKDFKRDILSVLIIKLKHKTISEKEARVISQNIIRIMSEIPENKIYQEMYELGKSRTFVLEVFLRHASEYELVKNTNILDLARVHIGTGDIDQAVFILRGGSPSEANKVRNLNSMRGGEN